MGTHPSTGAPPADGKVAAVAGAGVWTEIAELMVLRDDLERACAELEVALVGVRKRLHRLLDDEDLPAPARQEQGPDPGGAR